MNLRFCVLGVALLGACAAPARAAASLRAPAKYRVSIPRPHTQYVEVEVELGKPKGTWTDVAMPAWTPGSYMIRDFAKHVYAMRATAASTDKTLRVEPRDKQTWRVHHGGAPFTLAYKVFAAERTVRTSHVDDRHASLNGASLFVYVPGQTSRRCEVELQMVPGWTLHSTLPATVDGDVARFVAPDYDALVDSPVELGTPEVKTFAVDGTAFEFVVTGADAAGADVGRLAGDAQKVVGAFGEMMGGFPMKRYVFFLDITEHGGGGLEHADATMMMLSRSSFGTDRGYDKSARMVAHEFFHLWNVKRIHDVMLGPFDYARENHTDLLWFHEGFTETAEGLALLRSGLWTPAEYLRAYARRLTEFRQRPGRNFAPVAQMSHQAWTKGYKPEPNHRNVAVSYYDKGDLVGVALDLEIRKRSPKGSLMGVFRRLMKSHARKGKGITHADIVAAASAEAGQDMAPFFEKYVRGTAELPLDALIDRFGVEVEAKTSSDPWIGVELRGNTIKSVDPGSPADNAGLMREDEVIAVDGHRTEDERAIDRRLEAGKPATLHLFRDGRLVETEVRVETNPHKTYRFLLDKNADPAELELRKAWLGR